MMLNVEEMNFMLMFDTSSRDAAIQDINSTIPGMENEELAEIARRTVRKIEAMSEEEFGTLDFSVYGKEGGHD